jgi:hypothetical protein
MLVVHWDGKSMADVTRDTNSPKICERLAVAVSGVRTEKILGIPKLENGTGVSQASAVAELLIKWKLPDNVVAISFDTTASNTGKFWIFNKK